MPESMSFTWTGRGFLPVERFAAAAGEKFVPGAVYWMSVEPERTEASHRHEFAFVAEAWRNLPDDIAVDFDNPEVLRKRALIATGWCVVKDHACASRAEAQRLARVLQNELDDYAVVVVRDDVVRVCRAKSQARNRMKAAEFQRSKDDIIRWIAELIGVTPEALTRNARATA